MSAPHTLIVQLVAGAPATWLPFPTRAAALREGRWWAAKLPEGQGGAVELYEGAHGSWAAMPAASPLRAWIARAPRALAQRKSYVVAMDIALHRAAVDAGIHLATACADGLRQALRAAGVTPTEPAGPVVRAARPARRRTEAEPTTAEYHSPCATASTARQPAAR